jgi:conjugal transfer pilus assembly protein TrbC
MLHAHLLLRRAFLVFAATVAVSVSASESTWDIDGDNIRGPKLSPEEIASFRSMAEALRDNAIATASDPVEQQMAAEMKRRIDDIGNPEMAAEREKVLRFLGIDPDKDHSLFIFVSWSMPLDVLRSYAIEAMWTGSTLVFRGVPEGKTLPEFFLTDLRQLIWGDKAAPVSIDPRLYDSYGIKSVPAVVLTRTRENPVCLAGEVKVTGKQRTASYNLCPELDSDKFVKISGAVTVDYALESFRSAGFEEADIYLNSLRRGYETGRVPGKSQVGFSGEWNDMLGPIIEKYGPPRKIEQSSPPATENY